MNKAPDSAGPAGKARKRTIAALVAWALMVTVLSVLPLSVPGPKTVVPSDIVAHALFYIPLGALVYWILETGTRALRWAAAAIVVLAFGMTLEFVQWLLPFRAFEWSDGLADLAGGAAGAGFALLFPQARRMRFLNQPIEKINRRTGPPR